MKPQLKEKQWQCVPTAFATALDMTLADLLNEIGHDGSEIINSNLPEPFCRKGFHIQELIDACLRYGFAVTPVELYPVTKHYEYYYSNFGTNEPVLWHRFYLAICSSKGVIECQCDDGKGHAVAYEHGKIYDPDGYDYWISDLRTHHLTPICAWRIDQMRGYNG
jgi:hypothetical protein